MRIRTESHPQQTSHEGTIIGTYASLTAFLAQVSKNDPTSCQLVNKSSLGNEPCADADSNECDEEGERSNTDFLRRHFSFLHEITSAAAIYPPGGIFTHQRAPIHRKKKSELPALL